MMSALPCACVDARRHRQEGRGPSWSLDAGPWTLAPKGARRELRDAPQKGTLGAAFMALWAFMAL
jgi:hypothetical protein